MCTPPVTQTFHFDRNDLCISHLLNFNKKAYIKTTKLLITKNHTNDIKYQRHTYNRCELLLRMIGHIEHASTIMRENCWALISKRQERNLEKIATASIN